jgi:NitT/TauT family transport system ATP-binding protein
MVLIELEDVKKIFQTRKGPLAALENITFHVSEGNFVTIVGPSGCGKSTTLRIIAGLIPRTGGKLLVCGDDVNRPRPDIAVVFQTPNLLPWRNVINNVMLPVEISRLDRKAYYDKSLELLELCGLGGFEENYPHELSGGMKQRVAICRALIPDPPLLLMDEPFAALDALNRDKMNLELMRIWEKKRKTVLFITHHIGEAIFLSDQVIVMTQRPGKIREVIDIELPRPRTLETKSEGKFGEYELLLSRLLGLE